MPTTQLRFVVLHSTHTSLFTLLLVMVASCITPAWASAFLAGRPEFGSWFDWVNGWWAERLAHPESVLWLHYEDMQKQPLVEIKRVAAFLNIPSVDEALISSVALKASFDNMKTQADQKGGAHHMRKGVSGDWQTHFSEPLTSQFMTAYSERCRDSIASGLRYDFGSM